MDQNQGIYGTPMPFQQTPRKKPVWPWVLGGGILLFFVLLIVLAVVFGSSLGDEGTARRHSGDYVAVLHLEGTIAAGDSATYSQDYVETQLRSFIEDEENVGLVLYIDSPGGELYAVDQVYQLLLAYRATNRPIYAYCATYAASGGYYLACAADVITANRMSTVGSIGVTYGYHLDLTGLATKLGVVVTPIASDENKAMGGYFSPMTAEQKAIYQAQITEYYTDFINVVDAGRPALTRSRIITLADGRTYTANQAKSEGLIDNIGSFESMLAAMVSEEGISDRVEFVEFRYVNPGLSALDLLSLFAMASENPAAMTGDDLTALISALSRFKGPMVLYGMQ